MNRAASRLRVLAAMLDEVQREFEAEGVPLLSDVEDTRWRILALADRVEGRQWSGQ
jgi:hypothetical protein